MQIIAICRGCNNELPIIDMFRDAGAVVRIEVNKCTTTGCDPDFCDDCEDLDEANKKIEELETKIEELETEV